MNASIAEVDVVPTYKEVIKIDITDTPNPKFKTKTVVGKTVPKSSKKKAVKRRASEDFPLMPPQLRPRKELCPEATRSSMFVNESCTRTAGNV